MDDASRRSGPSRRAVAALAVVGLGVSVSLFVLGNQTGDTEKSLHPWAVPVAYVLALASVAVVLRLALTRSSADRSTID